MITDSANNKDLNINRRIICLGIILTTVILCLQIRLYKIMIVDSNNAYKKITQQIYRPIKYYEGFDFIGDIYDRNKKRLTNDGIEYKAVILPETAWKKIEYKNNEYINLLRIISEKNNTTFDKLSYRIRDEYRNSQRAVILPIDINIRDMIIKYNLSGIYTKEDSKKFSDNVGVTITSNFINNSLWDGEIKYDDSIDMKIFNYITRHSNKVMKVPVDAKGKVLPGLPVVEVTEVYNNGNEPRDVVLTLDYNIQKLSEETLNQMYDKNCAATVINIKTGEVLAMASKDKNGWERNMLTYSGRDYAYNPGSIFKIVVAAAALEDGIANEHTQFNCSGKSDSTGISCYKSDGHGLIGLEDAFALSCNVYFIELAKALGPEKIFRMSQKFGLGNKVLNFSKESKGTLYRDLKDARYDIGNIAIGQKDIMVTPLQVCDMVSTIANDGVRNKPFILSKVANKDGSTYKEFKSSRQNVISKQTAKVLQTLLKSVVDKGTGKKAQLIVEAAGKTGTPQRGSKTLSGRYQYEDAWFAGYFPYENPVYAISVYAEDVSDSSEERSIASLIFKNIGDKILNQHR